MKMKIKQLHALLTSFLLFKIISDYSLLFEIPSVLDNLIIIFVCFGYLYLIVQRKYPRKVWLCIGVFGGISLYTSYVSGYKDLLMTVLFITSSIGYNSNYIIHTLFRVKGLLLLIHILTYLILFISGNYHGPIIYKNSMIMHNFMFVHANTFAILICWVIIEWIYLNYNLFKKSILTKICIFIIISFFYWFTRSRTLLILLMAIFIISKALNNKKIKMLLVRALYILTPTLAVITFGLMFVYKSRGGFLYNIAFYFDELLTHRISLGARALETYGVTFLGQKIQLGINLGWSDYYGGSVIILDNIYMTIFFIYGWIYILIITWLIIKITNYAEHNGYDKVFFVLLLFLLYGITESLVINSYVSFPLLLIIDALNQRKIEEEQI